MGLAFGTACRAEIYALYRRRIENAIAQALQYGGQIVTEARVLEVAQRSIALTEAYDPAGWRELEGIAAGAQLPVVQVLAMNGLTDFRDVLSWPGALDGEGCTALVAQRDATRDGTLLLGQTWDLATDNLPHVIGVHRIPDDAPESWVLTTDGCLSLIGMNAAGLAVGTTNIRTTDARPGANYLAILHRMLSVATFDEALAAVLDAPRAGAHVYYLADATGQAAMIECSARWAQHTDLTSGVAVHANHCLVPENRAIEGAAPSPSSLARQTRMTDLATHAAARASLDVATFERFFADVDGGDNAICRDDIGGLNTNGAVIMCPERGLIRACHGIPARGTWIDLKAATLANLAASRPGA